MTFMLAEDLPTREARSTVTAEYFDALDEIVSNIHSRGMTHGDLRRRNLMRHPQTGLPVVIDFTQSLSRRNPLLRLFLPLARRIDRSKLLRLREWYVGAENMSQEQRRELEDGTPLSLRVGQMLRSRLYRPLKHWYKGEKGRRSRSRKGKRRP